MPKKAPSHTDLAIIKEWHCISLSCKAVYTVCFFGLFGFFTLIVLGMVIHGRGWWFLATALFAFMLVYGFLKYFKHFLTYILPLAEVKFTHEAIYVKPFFLFEYKKLPLKEVKHIGFMRYVKDFRGAHVERRDAPAQFEISFHDQSIPSFQFFMLFASKDKYLSTL